MSGYNKKPRKSRSSRPHVVPGGYQPHVVPGVNTGSVRPGSFPPGFTGSSASAVSGGPLGKGFGSDFPPISGSDPNFQNPYTGKDGSRGDGISRLFDSMNKGGNPLQNLLSLLNNEYWNNEFWSMFMQYALQQSANKDQRLYDQSLTKDQREYDWNMLQDSRLYNNPANELARLMGSGISRDAAIQILSGSAGGSGVGSGSSPVTNPAASAPAALAVPGSQNIQIAQTAMQGIQLVANLVQQGADIATAISTAQTANAQAYMSQSQLNAFQGVNDVANAFNRAVFDGTLTIEDVQGLRTADDYYKWITDHADTNLVKPLIQSGAVSNAFGSTYGREMFNHHLEQTRLARDSSRLFDSYVNSQELNQELQEIGVGQARRDYYVSLRTTLTDILSKDAGLALLYQQYLNGEKIIEINGKRVELAKYDVFRAERQNTTDEAYFNAFTKALDTETKVNQDGRVTTVTGQDILDYNAFTKLIRMYQSDAALSGLHGVTVPTKDGSSTVMSARERYAAMLNENVIVAITGAFLQDVIQNNRLSGYAGDLGSIYRFADMWNLTGLGNLVNEVTPDIAMPIVIGGKK